jgi:hypothetical protein
MFQIHSLNANGKFLRRFYEPLVLLKFLDPTRGAHHPDPITERGLDEHSKLWRSYVDQISFVCDFEKGGNTVTAVAVQKSNEAPIFWLASNSILVRMVESILSGFLLASIVCMVLI